MTLANDTVDERQDTGKFLTCMCILVQEVVEDPALSVRFRNWARRWGEDVTPACCTTPCTICSRAVMDHGGTVPLDADQNQPEQASTASPPQGPSSSSATGIAGKLYRGK